MPKDNINTDILIVGGGIVGLTIARELSQRRADLSITVIDKEPSLALHASGRNSGVVHAGFYYTPDTLKARFTVEGNKLLTDYCLEHGLKLLQCGKVVVARDESELKMLSELKRRGDANGVLLEMVGEVELAELEPNALTTGKALWSPSTSTINPGEVVEHIAANLKSNVRLLLGEEFLSAPEDGVAVTSQRSIGYGYFINTAGLYADKVAHHFGLGRKYTLIPFKGLYMEYLDPTLVKRHIYPVPDLDNPFLGVHYTKTVDGKVKIGPSATPTFWRENYSGMKNFRPSEFAEIINYEARMFLSNSSNFRKLTFEEIKKHFGKYLRRQAARLVRSVDIDNFGSFLRPGIRAQLIDTDSLTLVMDFVVEEGERSMHVLNAVSPAFTCSFSFARFIVDKIEGSL